MDILEVILMISIMVVLIITRNPSSKEKHEPPKAEKRELTEEEKRKFEKAKKAFNNLMTYDYDSALKGESEGTK